MRANGAELSHFTASCAISCNLRKNLVMMMVGVGVMIMEMMIIIIMGVMMMMTAVLLFT